jgi:hypothetical protein
MKRIQLALPVLAILFAFATSAFTTKQVSKSSTVTDLYWFDVSGVSPVYDGQHSKMDEKSVTGCDDETLVRCSFGFTQEQLVNGSPEDGPININGYTDRINKEIE